MDVDASSQIRFRGRATLACVYARPIAQWSGSGLEYYCLRSKEVP